MAVINRSSKFLRGLIKKYVVEIPDLTPEQKMRAQGAMEKVAAYVADAVAKAAESAARGAVNELKK